MDWRFWRRAGHFIEPAGNDDFVVMAEIHEAGFPHAREADTPAGLAGQPGATTLVARAEGGDGTPLGFVLVRSSGEEAEIITIATAPASRGRGVGEALMREAILRLRREGTPRLFLEVSELNAPALKLYRRLGFRQVGARRGYYASEAGPGRPAPSALVMELLLR